MTTISRTGVWACWLLVNMTASAAPAPAAAQVPRPGDVQWLTVITIAMQAGSTEKETRQVTYTPPPGWYIRSHRVRCTRKSGNSSYSVSTVPQDWAWSLEEKAAESNKTHIDLAGKYGSAGLKARYALEREKTLAELHNVRATHHALVVDATARGEGFLRASGGIELTVTAELVFVGTASGVWQNPCAAILGR